MAGFLLNCLRWPIWLAELATGAKSFADNPLIGSQRLNARGLHRGRVRLAHGITAWRRRRLARWVAATDRAAFAAQGYVVWRDVLPADGFARLRLALFGRDWPTRETVQGDAVTRRIAVDDAMLRQVPDLALLLRSPRWRGLLRYVAASRAEPRYYIQTILPHRGPQDAGADPQRDLHSDAFHPSMKAWLFLGDVAPDDGPLAYVAGSHRATPQRLAWEQDRACRAPGGLDRLSARGSLRVGDDELASLDLPQPTLFALPANTLVVADTYGFHARAPAAGERIRVELWAYARRNPFLPWTGLHLGSLPGLRHRRTTLIWRLCDRFPRILAQHWRPVGHKRPDAA